MTTDPTSARPHAPAQPSAAAGPAAEPLGQTVCVTALAAAYCAAMLAPQPAQLLSLVAAMLCARYIRPLLPLAVLLYAHAGSVVFASRALVAESSDFAVYFDLFTGVCTDLTSTNDTVYAFGVELGLPLLYHGLAQLGACRLSITGMAYLQSLVVSLAILVPLCTKTVRGRTSQQATLIVGGTLVLFSFLYVTQLSRQAISSALLLPLLLGSPRRRTTIAMLCLATLFHLTAPIVYGLALLMRSMSFGGLAVIGVVAAAAAHFSGDLLAWGLEHVDSFVGLAKLAYYARGAESDDVVGSDLRAIVYLVAAGLSSLPIWRSLSAATRRDAPMLLGFALLAVAMLPLPLAATRLTLAFSSLAIGFYIFRALAEANPRAGIVVLVFAAVFRSGLFNVFGPADLALWAAYPSASWQPLYYLSAF